MYTTYFFSGNNYVNTSIQRWSKRYPPMGNIMMKGWVENNGLQQSKNKLAYCYKYAYKINANVYGFLKKNIMEYKYICNINII